MKQIVLDPKHPAALLELFGGREACPRVGG